MCCQTRMQTGISCAMCRCSPRARTCTAARTAPLARTAPHRTAPGTAGAGHLEHAVQERPLLNGGDAGAHLADWQENRDLER